MISAGIKELKNHLSRYLSHVKRGEEVLITERGKVIARIAPEPSERKSVTNTLGPLITKGMVSLPRRPLNKRVPHPIEVPGKPVSEMIIEDRR